MFGWTGRATVRNIIIGLSSFVENSEVHATNSEYVASIVAFCGYDGPCIIENVVNMADVSFSGRTELGKIHLGGLSGVIQLKSESVVSIKNCINYGTIEHRGYNKGPYTDISGISAHISGSTLSKYMCNCLNYGEIIQTGEVPQILNMGGIIGHNYEKPTFFENCVNMGKITYMSSSNGRIGAIAGYVCSADITFTHCMWANFGTLPITGPEGFYKKAIDSYKLTAIDTTVVGELNKYSEKECSWNRWLLNTDGKRVSFNFPNAESLNMSSQLILFPTAVVDTGNMFS